MWPTDGFLGELAERFRTLFPLRRNPQGGFGRFVPEAREWVAVPDAALFSEVRSSMIAGSVIPVRIYEGRLRVAWRIPRVSALG